MPPHDPFDHSHCDHPRPRWELDLSPRVRLDLFYILHELWKYLIYGNIPVAVSLLEQFNDMLVQSALGMQENLEAEIEQAIKARSNMEEAVNNTEKDLQALANDTAFKEAMRQLFQKDQEGYDPDGDK